MRALVVDYGIRRMGVALGSEGKLLFSKMIPVRSEKGALAELTRLVDEEGIDTLVFGLPLRLDGAERAEARDVRRFAGLVAEGKHLAVVFVDERLSSQEAESLLRGKGMSEREMRDQIDRTVAELLLEQYFREKG